MAKKKATAAVVGELKRHPLSEKYGPKMSDDEQDALGADMKEHGQHEDIVLYEGMVLAGWNRYEGGTKHGVELRFKELEKGKDPVAVAFGTNFMRRKLSSVQKAFYGAQYAVDTGKKQTDVAKMMACNLNRLNQCVQLLKAGTDAAKGAIEQIKANPEMSGGAFDELMIEAGIARSTTPAPAPARTNTHADLDDDSGLDDDMTGGAIDSLLDEEDLPGDELPTPRKRGEIGEGADPLPVVGSKPSKMTNPHETPVSRVAKAFKALSADEQRQFIRFSWGRIKPALDAAIEKGDVEYVAPERKAGPPDPSIIARAPAKKAAKPTKKEATEAIKASAKRVAKKAVPAKKGAKK